MQSIKALKSYMERYQELKNNLSIMSSLEDFLTPKLSIIEELKLDIFHTRELSDKHIKNQIEIEKTEEEIETLKSNLDKIKIGRKKLENKLGICPICEREF